jgi:hypothetical protein
MFEPVGQTFFQDFTRDVQEGYRSEGSVASRFGDHDCGRGLPRGGKLGGCQGLNSCWGRLLKTRALISSEPGAFVFFRFLIRPSTSSGVVSSAKWSSPSRGAWCRKLGFSWKLLRFSMVRT